MDGKREENKGLRLGKQAKCYLILSVISGGALLLSFYIQAITENAIARVIYTVCFYLFPAVTIYAAVLIEKSTGKTILWRILVIIGLLLFLFLIFHYNAKQIDKYRSDKSKEEIRIDGRLGPPY